VVFIKLLETLELLGNHHPVLLTSKTNFLAIFLRGNVMVLQGNDVFSFNALNKLTVVFLLLICWHAVDLLLCLFGLDGLSFTLFLEKITEVSLRGYSLCFHIH